MSATGGKNMKKFKEWLEPQSVTDTKIAEQAWDLLAYLAYDTVQQVCVCVGVCLYSVCLYHEPR